MNAMRKFNRIGGPTFFGVILASLLSLAPLCRAAGTTTTTLVPALGWDPFKQGCYPVSLASDAAGNVWVGTEDNGVWKYDPAKKNWTQFTTKDGLGDDCAYALAFDGQNRLWVGHLNHGVSVYNGDKWRNYGLLDGPLGDRVFAIAVSPKDGDVWIATDMGLARYSEKRQDWDYYTRASGLPSDQIQCIAFDAGGQLYAGTQCDGIAIAGPDDNYTKWRTVTAPPRVPPSQEGDGLVSNLINNILTVEVPPAAVVALTPFGATVMFGDTWSFVHGNDWQEHTAGPYEASTVEPLPEIAEDWMTVLEVTGPHVWLGYRKSGVESFAVTGTSAPELKANVKKPATVFIRAILALPDEPPLFAAYDTAAGGLLTLANAPPYKPAAGRAAAGAPPPLPAPAPIPTPDDAKALAVRLARLTDQLAPGEAYYLADDWRTQGDWIGRYGGAYVKLCGMAENGDQDYALQPGYDVSIQVGPHHETNAAGPISYHDNDTSDDLRSLYDPTVGHRRDAEENDFSYDTTTYPESYNGPDLWVRVKVPDGIQCLSLYFLNNDAHTKQGDQYRDYDVQILPGDANDGNAQPGVAGPLLLGNASAATLDNEIQNETPLARTRVTDFWGGVYKQFIVCGPASYVVRIGRNRSFVTKLQAVFIDSIVQADNSGHLPGFDTAPYDPPGDPDGYQPGPLAGAAIDLWGQLDEALVLRGAVPLQIPLRIWCYRAAIAGQAPAATLERWRWRMGIWTPDDRKKFDAATKAAFNAIK
jgi:hypothetical protein